MGAVGYTSGDPRKVDRSGYAKGDVLAADAAGDLTAVPVGGDAEVFTADSSDPEGVDWQPSGGGSGQRLTVTWSRDGDATVVQGLMRWYNRTGGARTIHGVWPAAGVAPTGADLVVDVNKNGATIFATQANRPRIVVGGNGGASATPDTTSVAEGDYLTVDIDAVGSAVAGADVSVGVVMS
jgi:hypothetical protein